MKEGKRKGVRDDSKGDEEVRGGGVEEERRVGRREEGKGKGVARGSEKQWLGEDSS